MHSSSAFSYLIFVFIEQKLSETKKKRDEDDHAFTRKTTQVNTGQYKQCVCVFFGIHLLISFDRKMTKFMKLMSNSVSVR